MSNKVNGKRYDDNFKEQIVLLIKSSKEAKDVAKEYNIARSTVSNWTLHITREMTLFITINLQ